MIRLRYELILGSQSPRRQQLLREMGIDFTIQPTNQDEIIPHFLPIEKVAVYLAEMKARHFTNIQAGHILLTADTTVIFREKIMNKPVSAEQAVNMLQLLSGTQHEVITGICLRWMEQYYTIDDRTMVYFRSLQAREIEYYVNHYMPLDKAGAYGIQEWIGMIGIEKIEGSYFNVVGLPVEKLYKLMSDLDLFIL